MRRTRNVTLKNKQASKQSLFHMVWVSDSINPFPGYLSDIISHHLFSFFIEHLVNTDAYYTVQWNISAVTSHQVYRDVKGNVRCVFRCSELCCGLEVEICVYICLYFGKLATVKVCQTAMSSSCLQCTHGCTVNLDFEHLTWSLWDFWKAGVWLMDIKYKPKCLQCF